jgi:hypothetical protein
MANHKRAALPAAVCVAAMICIAVATGCAALPAASGAPSAPPTAQPSATPAPATAGPTPTPVAASSQAASTASLPSPSANPVTTPAMHGPPLPGTLVAGGAPPVAGQPGSWCLGGECVDAGVVAKAALPTLTLSTDADMLSFAVPTEQPFVHWSAWYAPTQQGHPTVLGQGGSIYDIDAPPSTPYQQFTGARFAAPAAGDWVLAVQLGFDGDQGGDASYYWRVVVP